MSDSVGLGDRLMIVLSYYRMLSGFIQTFDIPIDAQQDGSWIKE